MQASPCPKRARSDTSSAGIGHATGEYVGSGQTAIDAASGGFGPIAVRHLNAAHNLARWLIQDDARAEDIVLQAYAKVLRASGPGHVKVTLVQLMAVIRRTCLDNAAHSAPTDAQRNRDDERDRGPSAIWIDVRRGINGALQRLPFEFREVIVLREMEELSYRAISSITDVPVITVMSRLRCARAQLLRYLALSRTRPSDEELPREAADCAERTHPRGC